MSDQVQRVVFVSDAIRERNGVGTYYSDLAAHLADRLEKVELFSPELTQNGHQHIWSFSMPGDSTQRLYVPKLGQLAKKVREANPDIIVSPTPGPYGFYGLRLARLLKVGCCVGYHTDFERISDLYWNKWNRYVARISMKGVKIMNQVIFKRGAIVVANSHDMLESARRCGAKDARLVGTPVGKCFLDVSQIPINPKFNTIIYAGRLAPEKNLESVLESAINHPDIRFIIAGDGPLRAKVEETAKTHSNIDYKGWVGREDLLHLMDEAQMLVLPSSIESFGTIALEAMCRQRLVMVSPHCGINDWPDLAKGIYCMLENETLSDAIGRVKSLESNERVAKAKVAFDAAIALTEETIQQWIDIFNEIYQRKQEMLAAKSA